MPWGLGSRLKRKLLISNLQEANDHQANIWYVPKPMFQQTDHTNRPFVVGPDFTRRVVKYERFIRPMGLRYKKAHVTHPELKGKFQDYRQPGVLSAAGQITKGHWIPSCIN